MTCPHCHKGETRVIDSREDEQAIRRRRECMACQFRCTTFERIEVANLMVTKRDGAKEPFSREKLVTGIRLAGEKRAAVMEQADRIADAIERDLYALCKPEVSSRRIGQLVLEHLQPLDPVAYIRFASVYRSFDNLAEFEEELHRIVNHEESEVKPPPKETKTDHSP